MIIPMTGQALVITRTEDLKSWLDFTSLLLAAKCEIIFFVSFVGSLMKYW